MKILSCLSLIFLRCNVSFDHINLLKFCLMLENHLTSVLNLHLWGEFTCLSVTHFLDFKLFLFFLSQSSNPESAKDSPVTPPLRKEGSRKFCHPAGTGYSSSDSLDLQPRQSHRYSAGLASTPKPSSIGVAKTETPSIEGSVRNSLSRESDHSGEFSISNASDTETEWVEQDEPGVYITIRALPGGIRELRRVRFRSVCLCF